MSSTLDEPGHLQWLHLVLFMFTALLRIVTTIMADWCHESSYMSGGYSMHRRHGADPLLQNAPENITAATAMLSSSKVPPYWAPDLERRGYPFRTWVRDIGVWAAST